MTQALICYGTKTQGILDKLNYEVNGIKLIGCPDISQLSQVIKKSGSLQSILIFESALDKTNLKMPSVLVENKDVNVIFVLDDREIMKQYDIEYYQYDNIFILDNNGKSMTLIRLKNLISTSRVDEDELYKGDDIQIEDAPQEAPKVQQEEIPQTSGFKVETEDEQPMFDLESAGSNVEIFAPPERELTIEQDTPVAAPQVNLNDLKGIKEKIKDSIKIYNGLVIFVTGTTKSFTTTTVLNLAKYISSIDNTVGVIDLDSYSNGCSIAEKRITKEIGISTPLAKAIHTQDMLNSGVLIDTNFQLFSDGPLADRYELNNETVTKIREMIIKSRKFYDVIIIDAQLKDIYKLESILMSSAKVLFNIGINNKDLISFLRIVETIETDEFRNKVFESSYIEIDPKKNKLLGTKSTSLSALDEYLEQNQIVNEKKYVDMQKIGTIMKAKEYYDAYDKSLPYNEKEIERIIANLLHVK